MFAQEDLDEGAKYENLGPAYFDARRVAEQFMAKFEAENFKPMIEKLSSDIRDKLWTDLENHLMSDTEMNLQGQVWRIVDNCVYAILGNERWVMDKYALGTRYDCEKVRATIARHIPQEIQNKRIADLEDELKRAKDSIRFYQDR